MENQLLKTLAAKGCAVDEMLAETFMGREDFYVRMLAKLPANKSMEHVKAAVAANDATAVFDAAHELKGMYSTLGLTPLWTLCCKIVETTRVGSMEGVPEDAARMEAMHAEFVELVSSKD